MNGGSSMAISIVFFDMMGTLAHFVPEPEDLLVAVATARGITLSQRDARRGFAKAGEWWNRQLFNHGHSRLSANESEALYTAFDVRVLQEAGLDVEPQMARALMDGIVKNSAQPTLALYDDVVPALTQLHERGLRLGVLSNIGHDLPEVVAGLGIREHLDVLVSAAAAGALKPDPRIFAWGVKQAGVRPEEAAHVGDQYENDVLGARSAGLLPILIDRYGLLSDRADCPRVNSLLEVCALLAGP